MAETVKVAATPAPPAKAPVKKKKVPKEIAVVH
jgi:hypothetical protein